MKTLRCFSSLTSCFKTLLWHLAKSLVSEWPAVKKKNDALHWPVQSPNNVELHLKTALFQERTNTKFVVLR